MKTKYIEELVKILEESCLSEIEITDFFGRKIRLSKNSGNATVTVSKAAPSKPVKAQSDADHSSTLENPATAARITIKSPIVGTFYRAPSPDAPPYVEVGDIVKPGQVVCIVEAMKLLNEIESDVTGKIVEILVKNEDPVEYNQELFLVEPL